jgi:hypothetical protein
MKMNFNFYYPTFIALFGYIILFAIILTPEKQYDNDTGEIVRKYNFSIRQWISIILLILVAILSLYTINCLNFNFHLFDKKDLVAEKGNVFSRNETLLTRTQINELYKKKLSPKSNCIYMSWLIAFCILGISISVLIINIISGFKKKEKKTLFDKLAEK